MTNETKFSYWKFDQKILLLVTVKYSYCNADGCRCFSDFFYSIDERAVCRTSADAE